MPNKRHLWSAITAATLLALKPATAESPAYGTADDLMPGGAAIMTAGGYLYTTVGAEAFAKAKGLAVVDISGARPQLKTRLELENFPQDFARTGDYLLLVDGLNLITISIADPATPELIATTPLATAPEYGPQGICVQGKRAWLACRRQGVVEVDIKRPAKPRIVKTTTTPWSRGVALATDAQGKPLVISADDTHGLHLLRRGKVTGSQPLAQGCAVRLRVAGNTIHVAAGSALLQSYTLAPDDHLQLVDVCNRVPGGAAFGTYGYDVVPLPDASGVLLVAGESGIVPHLYSASGSRTLPATAATIIAPQVRAASLDAASGRLFLNGNTMDGRTMLGTFAVGNLAELTEIAPPLDLSQPLE